MPEFRSDGLDDNSHTWFGRADALVNEVGDGRDKAQWAYAAAELRTRALRPRAWESIKAVLYRLLARAELKAPSHIQGAFIPVGQTFDAFAAISKVLEPARQDILIVDPYLDEAVLIDFGGAIFKGVRLRLLADIDDHKESLQPAAKRWSTQHGAARPLSVRLATARALHDRMIFIDGQVAWTITQSLKDIAKRSHAEIIRADDTAPMKIAAYEAIWDGATIVI